MRSGKTKLMHLRRQVAPPPCREASVVKLRCSKSQDEGLSRETRLTSNEDSSGFNTRTYEGKLPQKRLKLFCGEKSSFPAVPLINRQVGPEEPQV